MTGTLLVRERRNARTPAHRRRQESRRVYLWLAAGGVTGAALVFGLLFLLFRPGVSLSSSDVALARVHTSGVGTEVTSVRATASGARVALVSGPQGLVPSSPLAQGESVQLTATATPPAWLQWLFGSSVSSSVTVVTPAAQPAATVALASSPGEVPIAFDRAVSVVQYSSDGGPARIVRLAEPSTVADLAVPAGMPAGSIQVAAAPRPWERVSARAQSVTWFAAPSGGSVTAMAAPAPGSSSATSWQPITLTFAEPVSKLFGSSHPTISPAVAGSWSEPDAYSLIFTPAGFGYGPDTTVTVQFPHRVSIVGAPAAGGGASTTAATVTSSYQFATGPASVLRLEEILAQLHYLPLDFVPAAGVTNPTSFAAELATMYKPLAGTFTWRWASTPATLQSQWSEGTANVMLKGALMSFEGAQNTYNGYLFEGETVDQIANATTWKALLQAAASGTVDPYPYSYVYVTKQLPETMTLWENGSVILTAAANTGIAQDPTVDGTFPIYIRFTVNYMSGTNPDGSHYHDLVYWINYFNGSDAVHGFQRSYYGSPQSLGCVELPVSTAKVAFDHLIVGDLVTVAG
jgi:hypothetical protein